MHFNDITYLCDWNERKYFVKIDYNIKAFNRFQNTSQADFRLRRVICCVQRLNLWIYDYFAVAI